MKTPRVELIYFPGCPNVDAAHEVIRAALAAEGLPVEWREWDRDDPATPEALRGYGSPTVLVNGSDIAPAEDGGECCRVYEDDSGFHGAPGVDALRAALRHAMNIADRNPK